MNFPRRIQWNQRSNMDCLRMGELGFSTRCICEVTGLSGGQVAYRLKKLGIRRLDYRNGDSPLAQETLRVMKGSVTRDVERRLAPMLKRKYKEAV